METLLDTPTSLLAIMPNTKEEIKSFSSKLIQQVSNGDINPLQVHVQLKAIEGVIKAVNDSKEYKDAIRSQSELSGKSFQAYGAKIDLVEVGTKYDYSGCNHSEYEDICKEIAILEGRKKEIESMLKTLSGPMAIITNHGEAVEVYPPIKSSTSSIKVTF